MLILTTASGSGSFELAISGSTQDYNVHSQLETQEGETITDPYNLDITISGGVVVGSTDTATYALDFNSVPSGSVVTVTMGDLSYIVGKGGDSNGAVGGPAVRVPAGVDVTFDTAPAETATIGGGGGAGGAGLRIDVWTRSCGQEGEVQQTDLINHGGDSTNTGGGGAGDDFGIRASLTSGGSGATPTVNSTPPDPNDPGSGGHCIGDPWTYSYTSVGPTTGGAGGGLGAAGTNSSYSGGAAGLAIQGIAQVTTGIGISVLGSTA